MEFRFEAKKIDKGGLFDPSLRHLGLMVRGEVGEFVLTEAHFIYPIKFPSSEFVHPKKKPIFTCASSEARHKSRFAPCFFFFFFFFVSRSSAT